MKKTIVVLSKHHYMLYQKGFEALNNIVDYFYIDKLEENYDKFKNNFNESCPGTILDQFEALVGLYSSVLFINLTGITQEILQRFDQQCRGKSSIWFFDTLKDRSNYKKWDIFNNIFSFEDDDIEFAKKNWGIEVTYIPLGTTYHLIDLKKPEDKYDVAFIGLGSPKRIAYLNKIAIYCQNNNKRLLVAGHFWHNSNFFQNFISGLKFRIKYPVLYKFVKNDYIVPEKLAQLYLNTKLLVNINIEKHYSFNTRNFDIMISNRLLITDKVQTDRIHLEEGRDFIMASDADDMVNKIDFYLNHEDEGRNIAANGYEHTKKCYLFDTLMTKILEKMGSL